MESEKQALVEEVERIRDYWVSLSLRTLRGGEVFTMDDALASAIEKTRSALSQIVSDEELKIVLLWCLGGEAHSFLTMLDGGTMLADKMRVSITGPSGEELSGRLHERLS